MKDHPYGLFYLSVAVAGADGKTAKEETFRYQVLPDLPEQRPGNRAGFDSFGWTYAFYAMDDPHNKPNADDQRMLKDYGFSWAHMRASWDVLHTSPGKLQAERLAFLDQWVDSALRQRAKIIFCLVDGIPQAIGDDTKLFEQMFREWAELYMRRYGDRVAVW